jgi:hypothetical protein
MSTVEQVVEKLQGWLEMQREKLGATMTVRVVPVDELNSPKLDTSFLYDRDGSRIDVPPFARQRFVVSGIPEVRTSTVMTGVMNKGIAFEWVARGWARTARADVWDLWVWLRD